MASAQTAMRAPRGAGGPERPGAVLVVDDEPLMLRALARILGADGHRIALAEGPEAARAALADPALDVVLLDLRLGAADGLDLLARIKVERPEVEVVVMTGHATIESAVGCMRQGAFDYLAKPFDDVHRVRTTVHQALERRRLVARNRELEARLEDRDRLPELIGHSPAMRRLARTVASLRHNESHVLIQGESGTGKELVARALHTTSRRREGPFVPVDCGALPESVIESELFGHERGAFTGAVGAPGLFRMAEGGTLFLDEIGEIPLAMQAKLLRALQYKEVRPVGAAAPIAVDIRVVTATHRDLAAMVETGRFRIDLFYRLHVVRLEIPPLRERIEDVPLLVHHFLEKHQPYGASGPKPGASGPKPGASGPKPGGSGPKPGGSGPKPGGSGPRIGIADDALARLMAHDWPGNVRELENVIESALALARGPLLRAADLPIGRTRGGGAAARAGTGAFRATGSGAEDLARLPLSLDAYERSVLERALRETGGNATEAARRLGIGRSTFYRKLGKHGLRVGPAGLVEPA